MYADDIPLLAPSGTALQQLLQACKAELRWLDMTINVKKSACMRIGPVRVLVRGAAPPTYIWDPETRRSILEVLELGCRPTNQGAMLQTPLCACS